MTIKIGILGCGMIGKAFAIQTIKNPDFQCVSLHSKSLSSLNTASKLVPSAKTYISRKEFLFNNEADSIIICTPHINHTNDAIECLAAGKNILIEKPIATNLSDLNELSSVAKKYPNLVISALPHGRFLYDKIIDILSSEKYIGKITSFHSYIDVPGPPRANWYDLSEFAHGGATLDTLPYALCRVLRFAKMNVKSAIGFKNQFIKHRRCLDGNTIIPSVDDNVTLVLEFENNQQAIVRSSWNIHKPEDFLIIRGRHGDLIIDCFKNRIFLKSSIPPSFPYKNISDIIDTTKTYQINCNSADPEWFKLQIFKEHIENGQGNLKELLYAMKILLSCLENKTILDIADPIYSSLNKNINLSPGNQPI